MQKKFHQFLLVMLDLFLRNKFFSILQFLGNHFLDFVGRVCSSFPILHTSLLCLFELDQPIDSPVVVVIDLIKEQYQNFCFPNVSPPSLPQLRIILAELIFSLRTASSSFRSRILWKCCTTFWSRSLFPFDTDPKRPETTLSRSMSAQVSLMQVRLATES